MEKMQDQNSRVNYYRNKGVDYCMTGGSEHYRHDTLQQLDLQIANGMAEDFCLGSIIKYAIRFRHTHNTEDLRKISDYAHILCGVELSKQEEAKASIDKASTQSCAATKGYWEGETYGIRTER